jgi:hypothetical protein
MNQVYEIKKARTNAKVRYRLPFLTAAMRWSDTPLRFSTGAYGSRVSCWDLPGHLDLFSPHALPECMSFWGFKEVKRDIKNKGLWGKCHALGGKQMLHSVVLP